MTTPAVRADGARVLADLAALRQIGIYKTGVHRPSYTPEHMHSIRWLMHRMPEAGLTPALDGIGNVIGTSARSGPKLLTGSHLESQNHAGWLDGPLGVVYALEAARVLNDRAGASGAVEVAAWADEEGHYGTLLGSRSFIGAVDEAEIDAGVNHTTRKPLRTALAEAGLAGLARQRVDRNRYMGYLEAHIEQGDTLEREGLKIGVVTAIVGIWQYEIAFTGQQNHAGTTSMQSRKDAGVALAKLCVAIDEAFPTACGPRTVWTTGRITLEPGAPSIIPGRATMLFQMRDTDPAVIARLEGVLDGLVTKATRAGPCSAAWRRLREGHPAAMDATIQGAVAAAAEEVAPGQHLRMPSGAGHDAQFLAQVMPAGMLFVPSIGGISHHWTENTSDDDIVTGAHVFVAACARLLDKA